jgi:glycerol-3-phosphate acyltransferase PlsY
VPLGIYLTLWLALAFLCGSVPFGWLVARARGVDLARIGSGNIGATNVARALGWGWGGTVLLLDTLKGLIPVAALTWCLASVSEASAPLAWRHPLLMLAGLAAVLGHTFTPWLGFRGGKGVATGLGVVLALYQWWVVVPLAVFGLTVLGTRYVSLGSILGSLTVGGLSFFVPALRPLWPFGLLTVVLVLFTHRENIRRLLAGREHRLGQKPGGTTSAGPPVSPEA